MKFKRQEYGHITVILAASIIPTSVRYMKNKSILKLPSLAQPQLQWPLSQWRLIITM